MAEKRKPDPLKQAEGLALKARIKKMAKRWCYAPDELREAQALAEQDPEGWTRLVEYDERN